MLPFKRASSNKLDRWFFTINKPMLIVVILLLAIGLLLNLTASPYVAIRIGAPPFYFFYRHLFYVVVALIVLIGISFLNKEQLIKFAYIIFISSLLLIFTILFSNIEVKGAKRWIHIFGVSIQPSEFAKIAMPLILAHIWLYFYRQKEKDLTNSKTFNKWIPFLILLGIYFVTVSLIIKQPDLGMVFLISIVFGTILMLVGLKVMWILLLAILGVVSLIIAYFALPHVHSRIDNFFNETKPYQVIKAREAMQNGGILGVGAGKGYFKQYLPDAHTDFIFAVMIEEYGLTFVFIILGLFSYLFFTIYKSLEYSQSMYDYIAGAGLWAILMIQTLIHIASNVSLIPTKGMTLPFISYGGSSLLANALLMGFLLVLTKKNY